ncbi:hypothetical protein T05_1272 [Trichinella murrelli]|uniref:Uncharacterized protein n=1 Tax=Trichinella murrelli TaxID=144512 RepID=A0A0V0U3N6_9BILA|nr:hypothetical protein T05_1272 [Trichinella murrelli]
MERRKFYFNIIIAKSPIRKLQMRRRKSTSEPNCIQKVILFFGSASLGTLALRRRVLTNLTPSVDGSTAY